MPATLLMSDSHNLTQVTGPWVLGGGGLAPLAWAPAGIFAGVGKGSAKRSVGKGVWGSAGSSPSGVWGRAPAQLARGSGGAL